ncbi:MAG: antibiotic biosynthesis monooxygenase [Sphingorhabdus sp.]
MIIEHALLQVRAGEELAFEAAMAEAKPLIAASPGFLGIEVRPSAESAGTYLLLVRWQSVADHRDGFRQSDRYQAWRDLLHQFYDPMPTISYFGDTV